MTGIERFDPAQYSAFNWMVWTSAVLITIFRLAVRLSQTRRLQSDDIWIIVATVCLTALAALNQTSRAGTYLMIASMAGEPPKPPFTTAERIAAELESQRYQQFFAMFLFWTTLWSVKASLLMFIRRLLGGVDGYMRWWWIVVGISIGTYIGSCLTNVLGCYPIKRRFVFTPGNECSAAAAKSAIWVATTMDIVSDILIAVLPIPLLFGLRISLKQKIGIGATFTLGGFVAIISIIRLSQVLQALDNASPLGNVSVALWSIMEASTAVIIGNMPALKSLITRHDSKSSSSSSSRDRYKQSPGPAAYGYKQSHQRLHDVRLPGEAHVVRSSRSFGSGITETEDLGFTKSGESMASGDFRMEVLPRE